MRWFGCIVFEKKRRQFAGKTRLINEAVQQRGQFRALTRGHFTQRMDQAILSEIAGRADGFAPGGGQRKFHAAPIQIGRRASNQPSIDQALNDDGYGTLVCQRARGKFVNGDRSAIGEFLEHEQLRTGKARGFFRSPRRHAQGSDDLADGVEYGAGVAVRVS